MSHGNISHLLPYYDPDVRRQFYSVSVPILLTYSLIAFLVNAGVLLTVFWIKCSFNPTLRLTISLTLADVWTSATVAFSLVYNSYLYYVYNINTNACLALTSEVLRLGGFFSGIFHLLALAVNHYLSTAHPFLSKKLITPTTTTVTVILLWFVPTVGLFVGFSSIPGQGYQTPNGTCRNHSFSHTFEFRVIILSLICILLVVMSAIYVTVVIILHRMKRKFNKNRKFSSYNQQRQQLSRKRKTFVTTLLIWGTFFLGWFPTSLMYVLMCQDCPYSFNNYNYGNIVYVFGFLGIFFILTKTLANPIIYAVRIPEINGVLRQWRVYRNSSIENTTKIEFDGIKNRTRKDEEKTLLQHHNFS